MAQPDRRKLSDRRQLPDDCTQCGIWAEKIAQYGDDARAHREDSKESFEIVHSRIDTCLSWKVFTFVIILYFGISIYNAKSIQNVAVDVAKVQTKIESVEKTVARMERSIQQK